MPSETTGWEDFLILVKEMPALDVLAAVAITFTLIALIIAILD